MLASTKEAHAMMTNIIFCLLFFTFMIAALAAGLSTIMGFYAGTILAFFCMGATAYGLHSIQKYLI
jgi:hypothetical protein